MKRIDRFFKSYLNSKENIFVFRKQNSIQKVKVKVKQSHYRPGQAQRVPGIKGPRLHDGTE